METKYKVLKAFSGLKKGAIFVPSTETPEEIATAVEKGFLKLIEDAPMKAKDISKVTFLIRNPDTADKTSLREFSAEEHGEDFVAVANEFAETNEKVILKRKEE